MSSRLSSSSHESLGSTSSKASSRPSSETESDSRAKSSLSSKSSDPTSSKASSQSLSDSESSLSSRSLDSSSSKALSQSQHRAKSSSKSPSSYRYQSSSESDSEAQPESPTSPSLPTPAQSRPPTPPRTLKRSANKEPVGPDFYHPIPKHTIKLRGDMRLYVRSHFLSLNVGNRRKAMKNVPWTSLKWNLLRGHQRLLDWPLDFPFEESLRVPSLRVDQLKRLLGVRIENWTTKERRAARRGKLTTIPLVVDIQGTPVVTTAEL